jgi:hypothetical protein
MVAFRLQGDWLLLVALLMLVLGIILVRLLVLCLRRLLLLE